MKKILATLLLALAMSTATAQLTDVQVWTETQPDNSLAFFADVAGYGTFTVWLTIPEVGNANAYNQPVMLRIGGSGEIFRIHPTDAARPVTADFRWDWINGTVDAIPDLGFVYRLPVGAGRTTIVSRVTPADAGMMRGNYSNFTIWQFTMENNDQVFAIRKGTVISVEGFPQHGAFAGREEDSTGNVIVVEHADGTQARYSGMSAGSLMVSAGDVVTPETPLALAGNLANGATGVRVWLYHYVSNRNTAAHSNMHTQTDFINPVFSTTRGNNILTDGETVTAKVTKDIITAEAGKKSFWQRLFGK